MHESSIRSSIRQAGFESDLARDKSILNFAFTMFMGIIAALNFIKANSFALISAILAMDFCLVSVYLSLKVLKNNRDVTDIVLSLEEEPKPSVRKLLKQNDLRCLADETWAHRFFWGAIICLVLCVIFYSDISIVFASNT